MSARTRIINRLWLMFRPDAQGRGPRWLRRLVLVVLGIAAAGLFILGTWVYVAVLGVQIHP